MGIKHCPTQHKNVKKYSWSRETEFWRGFWEWTTQGEEEVNSW
jgi:hypothetical protein